MVIDLISLIYIYTDGFYVTLTSLNKIAELLAFFQITKHTDMDMVLEPISYITSCVYKFPEVKIHCEHKLSQMHLKVPVRNFHAVNAFPERCSEGDQCVAMLLDSCFSGCYMQ